MKGYLLLTEARSGSNWLGSLANNTGRMGRLDEWLDPNILGVEPLEISGPDLFDRVIAAGRSDNERFAIKIFPRHLHRVQETYGFDFIAECQKRYETSLVLLERRDRLRQAISYARGLMTSQWTSTSKRQGEARYDAAMIARAHAYIEQSYAFWRSYLDVRGLEFAEFCYEDLLPDPSLFVDHVARRLGVEAPPELRSNLNIQRDSVTEEWSARFRADVARMNVLEYGVANQPPARTFRNLKRFFRKQPLVGQFRH